jgi:hypothetical protein
MSMRKLLCGALVATLALAQTVSAALIWQTPGVYTTLDDTSFQTYTQAASFNIGTSTSGTTTWGEDWTNVNQNGGTVGGITISTAAAFRGVESNSALYPGGNAVLNSQMYASDGHTITLSGLFSDTKYLIQYLVADNRNYGDREQWFQQGTNLSLKVDPIGVTASPQFVVFGAELTDATSIAVNNKIGRYSVGGSLPTISAVRVSVIPEPATGGMLLLGAAGFLGLLRRKLHG